MTHHSHLDLLESTPAAPEALRPSAPPSGSRANFLGSGLGKNAGRFDGRIFYMGFHEIYTYIYNILVNPYLIGGLEL